MNINTMYLTFHSRWQIVQHPDRFSDLCGYCGASEDELNNYSNGNSRAFPSLVCHLLYCIIDFRKNKSYNIPFVRLHHRFPKNKSCLVKPQSQLKN